MRVETVYRDKWPLWDQGNCLPDSRQRFTSVLGELALPYSYHYPSLPPQLVGRSAVSSLVPADFLPPRVHVCLWRDVLPAAVAMPKTSVNKGSNPGLWPHKVGPPSESLMSAPPVQSRFSEQRSQPLLGRSVSRAVHSGHQLSARQPPECSLLFSSVARPLTHFLFLCALVR